MHFGGCSSLLQSARPQRETLSVPSPAAPGRCARGAALTLPSALADSARFARQQRRNDGYAAPEGLAHSSRVRMHDGDARWVGGALTSSAVLPEPSRVDVSTPGHRARTIFIIGRMIPCSELSALLPPVTPSPRSKPWTSRFPGSFPGGREGAQRPVP